MGLPQHDDGKASAATIALAQVGDMVWVFHSQNNVYDAAGNYLGRGRWVLAPIVAETRQSFLVSSAKFDRITGNQRGTGQYTPTMHIYGEVEKQDHIWTSRHRFAISKQVEACDVATLRKIADLIGYVAEDHL